MAENGYLILADITGYTQYLSESELDHAQEIITAQINTIINHLHVPIILSRVEGDMVFAYTVDGGFIHGQALLEAVEHIYYEFTHSLESNDRNTTCQCKACQNMHTLDLKVIIHFGEFGLQKLGSQTELIGTDVNAAHRLLKNSITQVTGIEAYLFLSNAAIKKMMLGEFTKNLIPHSEDYEHVGEIPGLVYDLKPFWQRERERRREFISPIEAYLIVEENLPVPPAVAWTYLNEPEYRARYRHSDSSSITGINKGRVDIGSTYHCVHGDEVILETILDWKPFDFITYQAFLEIMGVNFTSKVTIQFEDVSSGTHIKVLSIALPPKAFFSRIIFHGIIKPMFKIMGPRDQKQWFSRINEFISEDRSSGKLKMIEIASRAAQ